MDEVAQKALADVVPGLPHPITLLINAHSRTGKEQFARAVEMLKAAGVPLREAVASESKEESFALIQREIKGKSKLIIIGGGDGTLSLCAGQLVGSDTAMAVLPLGTGNTLARSLGIPVDLQEAITTIANGHVESVDVGKCNDQVFLNSVTLGLSAEIAHALDGETKKKLGLLAWPVVGGRVLRDHRPLLLKVSSPDKTYRVRTHQIVVANGRYVAGPIAAAPDASIQSHELNVFVLGGAEKWDTARAALRWLRGEHIHDPDAKFFSTQNVRIESLRGRVKADVDGEISGTTPLDISIWPLGLKVVVPRGFDAETV